MSATKARRLIPYKDFTHYLSVPITTRPSRLQLQASFARFERETSAIIPEGSVANPDYVKLNFGRLKLGSKERIDACSKHLHSLNMDKILGIAAVNAMNGPPKFEDLPYSRPVSYPPGVATIFDMSPLKVDMAGISSPNESPSRVSTLEASFIDRTHRSQHFQHIILVSLFKAGFLANAFYNKIPVVDTAIKVWLPHKGTRDPKTGRWSNPVGPRIPLFDASDLIDERKDYKWATNVRLEKLGVYALGSREKLPGGGAREKQMTEAASVALPLVHEMRSTSNLASRVVDEIHDETDLSVRLRAWQSLMAYRHNKEVESLGLEHRNCTMVTASRPNRQVIKAAKLCKINHHDTQEMLMEMEETPDVDLPSRLSPQGSETLSSLIF